MKNRTKKRKERTNTFRWCCQRITLLMCLLFMSMASMAQVNFAMTKSMTNVTCRGGSDGTATLLVTGGGTAPYSYSWNTVPSQSTSTATGLKAGSYSVYVSDAAGNSGNWTIPITQPAAWTMSKSMTSVTCNGGANGTASIVVLTGGTAPYSYSWSTSPPQTTTAISGLSSGTYTVYVTDANGCTGNWSLGITQPTALSTSTII